VTRTHLGDQSGSTPILASSTRESRSRTISTDQQLSRDERAERRRLGISATRNPHTRTRTSTRSQTRNASPTDTDILTYRQPPGPDFSDSNPSSPPLSTPSSLSPTPAHTPIQFNTVATTIQISLQSTDDDMTSVELFHGRNIRKQNPQNWLRTLEANKFKHDSDDDTRLYIFSKHLEFNSKADTWFENELLPGQKDTWDKLVTEFNRKWPATAKVEPTKAELQQKLLEVKLKDEDVGVKVGDDEDDQVWSHVDWAQRVRELAEDIGDSQGLLISIVRGNLPVSIRSLLPNDISTWDKFCDGVCGISIDRLGDEMERNNNLKSTNDAITNLTISSHTPAPRYNNTPTSNYQRAPYRTPYHRYQPVAEPQTPSPPVRQAAATPPTPAAPSTPSTPRTRGTLPTPYTPTPFASRLNAGNAFAAAQPPASPFATGKSGYEDLAHQAIANNLPYPNTDEGRRLYMAAVTTWKRTHGENTAPDWSTGHFPLSPGTAPLGSSECFRCGIQGHMRPVCESLGHTEIPKQESDWRARIQGIIKSRRTRDTLPVFIVDSEEVAIDTSVYDTSVFEFADTEDQGNEQGSRS
jgi:hypothetical protein